MKIILQKLMSLVAVKTTYLVFALASIASSGVHANITIMVTGDGNASSGSVFTLSGSGTSTGDLTTETFTFGSSHWSGATTGGIGSMQIQDVSNAMFSQSITGSQWQLTFVSQIPSGTNLSAASGSYTVTNSVWSPALNLGDSFIATGLSGAWGTLTITQVPEPSTYAALLGGCLSIIVLGMRFHCKNKLAA